MRRDECAQLRARLPCWRHAAQRHAARLLSCRCCLPLPCQARDDALLFRHVPMHTPILKRCQLSKRMPQSRGAGAAPAALRAEPPCPLLSSIESYLPPDARLPSHRCPYAPYA